MSLARGKLFESFTYALMNVVFIKPIPYVTFPLNDSEDIEVGHAAIRTAQTLYLSKVC